MPLLEVETFNIFKTSPISTVQEILNSSFTDAYIWPILTYFAISTTDCNYLPIPAEEMRNLRELQDALIVVNPKLKHEIRDSVSCEIKIATSVEAKNPEECNICIKKLCKLF